MLSQLLRYAPVISLIRKTRPRSILEVGCGSQGIGRFLSWRFVGVDRTFADYTGTERRASPWMLPLRADATSLPFSDGRFDLVVLLDVLEHVPTGRRGDVLAECDRVAHAALAVGFPCGEPAEAHDRELHRWLEAERLPVPGWLREHLAEPLPTLAEVSPVVSQSARDVRVLENAWLPVHRGVMRWEARERRAPFSAALSDLLAPTTWDWGVHRPSTNLARVTLRPAWPLLRLLDRAPAYRKLLVVDKRR
ncbi:MAG: class I SAM-dependent methyltransferase [Candidatus Rokubacteria bacterium]|nr:class I SAM-dependent methyltransferase [Candidatus Rokubacteria bacterium]